MSIYWFHSGDAESFRAKLLDTNAQILAALVFNERYNDFCRSWSDAKEESKDYDDILNGKRIPYMGWFWRSINFWSGEIPLGFNQGYVGFMENNKWDHHERLMSPHETKQLMLYLDEAMESSRKGGDLGKIHDEVRDKLKVIRDWMQGLPRLV